MNLVSGRRVTECARRLSAVFSPLEWGRAGSNPEVRDTRGHEEARQNG